MINILRAVQRKQIIHRDIKPNNILFHQKTKDAYLIDFGLSKMFTDENGEHNLMSQRAAFRGTYKFCSINMHNGYEQSRRDDLESLGYVLIFIQKGECKTILTLLGFLPWKYLNEDPEVVRKSKMRTSLQELCQGLHQDFYHFLDYAKKLKFEEKPDYDYCLALMERIVKMNGAR